MYLFKPERLGRLSQSERTNIAQALRKHVRRHTDEMTEKEHSYYETLLDNFITHGTPSDLQDQKHLTQLLLASGG